MKCYNCKKEKSSEDFYPCPNCGIALCSDCTKTGGFLSTARYCPYCNKEYPKSRNKR